LFDWFDRRILGNKPPQNAMADALKANMQAQLAEAQASRASQERIAAAQMQQIGLQGEMMRSYMGQIEAARAETEQQQAAADTEKSARLALEQQTNPGTAVRRAKAGGRSLFSNSFGGFDRTGGLQPA
jgi:hypothetical protein